MVPSGDVFEPRSGLLTIRMLVSGKHLWKRSTTSFISLMYFFRRSGVVSASIALTPNWNTIRSYGRTSANSFNICSGSFANVVPEEPRILKLSRTIPSRPSCDVPKRTVLEPSTLIVAWEVTPSIFTACTSADGLTRCVLVLPPSISKVTLAPPFERR